MIAVIAEGDLLIHVTPAYAERALARGEAVRTDRADVIALVVRHLRPLTPAQRRKRWLTRKEA